MKTYWWAREMLTTTPARFDSKEDALAFAEKHARPGVQFEVFKARSPWRFFQGLSEGHNVRYLVGLIGDR